MKHWSYEQSFKTENKLKKKKKKIIRKTGNDGKISDSYREVGEEKKATQWGMTQ